MKRFQAMGFKKTNNGGNNTPATLPPGWNDQENIFIHDQHLTRYDHITLPYWSDFVEYCENVNSNWTLQNYINKIDPITNTSSIGITKLKLTPLTDIQNPPQWTYNNPFTTTQTSVRWTQGNEGFKIYSFYHLTHIEDDWSSLDRIKKGAMRLREISTLISSLGLYADQNATVDQMITNRSLNGYYGTKIKGNGGGSQWVDLFKIGETETLKNVQRTYANAYSGRAHYNCYDFFKNQSSHVQPFSSYYMSENMETYYNPNLPEAMNKVILDAAPVAIAQLKVYEETVNSIKHTILANVIVILTINDTTEANVLT